jgi:hypothetical protein
MISWWWLLVEAVLFVLLWAVDRGAARSCALSDALENPDAARAELVRRWCVDREALRYRYGPRQ